MEILHIVAAYTSIDYHLNDDGLCIVNVRGQEPKLLTIEEVTNNFLNIPWVKGCGGIITSYIFNTETRDKTII